MEFEKFKSIIDFNKLKMNQVTDIVRDFSNSTLDGDDKYIIDLMQTVRTAARQKRYMIILLPIMDREIGAMMYRSDFWGYILLNTALPMATVNFALGHELYHVLSREQLPGQTIELYIGEKYNDEPEEKMANCFSGVLTMPDNLFKRMYSRFYGEDSFPFSILCKLMSFFKVPYIAALIRCYELELLPDKPEILRELLIKTDDDIEREFERFWLNTGILRPSMENDFKRLRDRVCEVGENIVSKSIMNDTQLSKILSEMDSLYGEIIRK